MKRIRQWFGRVVCAFVIPIAVCGGQAFSAQHIEDKLTPTRAMRAETMYMVRCMEELHLEHRNISLLDNRAILSEFLTSLDPWKMIFLQKDADATIGQFVPTLDIFVSGGSLFPAFSIFEGFRTIAHERVDWIFSRLNGAFNFAVNETFAPNRKDCSWPQTADEADLLWEKRLKFEILNEAIGLCKSKNVNKKNETPFPLADPVGEKFTEISYTEEDVSNAIPEATENIRRRYESWRRSWRDVDSWLVQEMFLNSISRMYDPHTSFLSKDSFEDLNVMIRNSLTGIGAELHDENGVCTVSKLTPGGPAKLSGEIKVGDKIIAVAQGDDGDFVDIVGLRLYKAVKLLRGKKDTVVRAKLETVSGDTKVVRLVRDTIKMNATRASAKYFELERGGNVLKLGVIELPSFYGDVSPGDSQSTYADRDVKTLIEMLRAMGVDGLVLDLRQNGGGLLQQAILITGLFITTGPVVQIKDSFGKIEKLCDEDENIAWDGPLVVLSSSMSASASEILIGALRDHRRAIIVGAEATYGKGSVQMAFDMNMFFNALNGVRDLGAAYITVQKWYLPTGVSTQLKGVPSDIKLFGLDECFHRREADYPHALGCDEIPPVEFERKWEKKKARFTVTDSLIAQLDALSKTRQETLDEFKILRRRVDHFDGVVNRVEFTLEIPTRLAEKRDEEKFKVDINAEIEALAESQGYRCQNVELPDIEHDTDSQADEKPPEDIDGIVLFDTNLRECLRIIADWVMLSTDHESGEATFTGNEPGANVQNLQR
ncbi:MAG: carboxy terminal-processing peptidase [Puniceicoccales bacterium]|jgi:carboxyl-terminal processing protease|nr:carboxy terminal-processing peptidase [Puniceicoccales bacterium]